MQALVFYLTYPFIYLVASLPFRAMYILSDFMYYAVKFLGYRKEVVAENLKYSFPEKSAAELRQISNRYYRFLCDLTLESLKTMTMTEKQSQERTTIQVPDWLERFAREKRSIMLIVGHYGNWEWAGPTMSLNTPFQLVVIYRPLTNPYFEKMMVRARTKFGTRIVQTSQTLREMVASRGKLTATAFVADQAAPANAYWTTFLNQKTSVFTGPEKLAVKFNYPVVYLAAKRRSRGYYEVNLELLFENPSATVENEISETFTRRLERDIIECPEVWLWSHRRWKLTRLLESGSAV